MAGEKSHFQHHCYMAAHYYYQDQGKQQFSQRKNRKINIWLLCTYWLHYHHVDEKWSEITSKYPLTGLPKLFFFPPISDTTCTMPQSIAPASDIGVSSILSPLWKFPDPRTACCWPCAWPLFPVRSRLEMSSLDDCSTNYRVTVNISLPWSFTFSFFISK